MLVTCNCSIDAASTPKAIVQGSGQRSAQLRAFPECGAALQNYATVEGDCTDSSNHIGLIITAEQVEHLRVKHTSCMYGQLSSR